MKRLSEWKRGRMSHTRTVPVNVYSRGVRFERLNASEVTSGLREGAPVFVTRGDLAYLLWSCWANDFLMLSRSLRMSRDGDTLVIGTLPGVSPFLNCHDITKEMRVGEPSFKIHSHGLLQLSWGRGDHKRYLLTRMMQGIHRDRPSRPSGTIQAINRITGHRKDNPDTRATVSTDLPEHSGRVHPAESTLPALPTRILSWR